jgi:hypothetical protein
LFVSNLMHRFLLIVECVFLVSTVETIDYEKRMSILYVEVLFFPIDGLIDPKNQQE